jgi:hypothetical protein
VADPVGDAGAVTGPLERLDGPAQLGLILVQHGAGHQRKAVGDHLRLAGVAQDIQGGLVDAVEAAAVQAVAHDPAVADIEDGLQDVLLLVQLFQVLRVDPVASVDVEDMPQRPAQPLHRQPLLPGPDPARMEDRHAHAAVILSVLEDPVVEGGEVSPSAGGAQALLVIETGNVLPLEGQDRIAQVLPAAADMGEDDALPVYLHLSDEDQVHSELLLVGIQKTLDVGLLHMIFVLEHAEICL